MLLSSPLKSLYICVLRDISALPDVVKFLTTLLRNSQSARVWSISLPKYKNLDFRFFVGGVWMMQLAPEVRQNPVITLKTPPTGSSSKVVKIPLFDTKRGESHSEVINSDTAKSQAVRKTHKHVGC